MTIELFHVVRVIRFVNVLEIVVIAGGIQEDGVMDTAKMFRTLLGIVVRGLSFPDNLIDETGLPEDLCYFPRIARSVGRF